MTSTIDGQTANYPILAWILFIVFACFGTIYTVMKASFILSFYHHGVGLVLNIHLIIYALIQFFRMPV
jgi:hypothetical protein